MVLLGGGVLGLPPGRSRALEGDDAHVRPGGRQVAVLLRGNPLRDPGAWPISSTTRSFPSSENGANPETLWKDHVDNAVVEAMLEGADEGDEISRSVVETGADKACKGLQCHSSTSLAVWGPFPEGMDATAALRNLELTAMHEKIRDRVLAQAADFQQQQGYRPPYWDLVRMANKARKDVK